MSPFSDTRGLSPGEVIATPSAIDNDNGWQENFNIHLLCPDCKEEPPNLVEEFASGDTVCASCGLVLSGRIVDTRSEWRTFSNDDQGNDDPSRVGDAANPFLHGSQLHTNISFSDGGMKSRELQRAQSKVTFDKANKSLLAAYREIAAMCESWHLSGTVIDTAKHLFKMVEEGKAFKGKSQDAIIAGCIFIACRQNNVPRTFREIFSMTNVTKKEIGRTFKALDQFFAATRREKESAVQGGLYVPAETYATTSSTRADELCLRYCNHLQLSSACTMVAQELANKMSSVGSLAGRSPLSAAAACIYMGSHLMGEPKSAREIANVAGVSDGTIRTAYKQLYAERERLIKSEWLSPVRGGDMKRLPNS